MSSSPITLRRILRRLLTLFLQGLVVLAPIGITLWVVIGLFNFVDGILPNVMHALAPGLWELGDNGQVKKIPGTGFLVVVLLVLITGWISSLLFFSRVVAMIDNLLEKTPGIKYIYSSVKDFLEAFAGNKKKFDKPVLVNVDAPGVWRIGFITQKSSVALGMSELITVYVPHSYAISGITYLVPANHVKPLSGITAADAMKYTISGGVTEVETRDETLVT
ncbi:MAG: DUF502 domain-containing protein [Sediminibacterium sp.]